VRLVSSAGDAFPLPPGHRFPSAKYAAIAGAMARGYPDLCVPAARASWEDLGLVHDAGYLAALRRGLDPTAARRLGFPWSERLVERARCSVGGTLAALAWALAEGAAGHLAGGTHHAFRDRGEGFCVFNDLAVAVAVARRDHAVRRIAIVDLDVHQGNGTASLLGEDPDVLTLSLHGARNYPFQKVPGSLDVPLSDGCEDADYLAALDPALEQVAAHRPELLLYQAGVDALRGDRFGRLALSHLGLEARDARVYRLARKLGVPLVVTLGGGYHRDLDATIAAHVAVYRGLVEWTS
jgi:acetoin utilization deacetylase AcuC-like enzyme